MSQEYIRDPLTPEGTPLIDEKRRLDGKIALVASAGLGIGRGKALSMASRGAAIIVVDRCIDGAEQTAEDIRAAGGRAIAIAVDITIKAQVEMLAKQASGIFGGLDIVVNSAGFAFTVGTLEDQHNDQIKTLLTYDINASISQGNNHVSGW